MKTYIGTKIIQAEPMKENDFRTTHGRPTVQGDQDGYLVRYPDGYESWSPKDVFESAYREISDAEKKLI